MKNQSNLVIVDHSLKDERGHHYTLAKLLSQAAVQNDLNVIWFVNKEFTGTLALEGVKVCRVFSNSMYDQFVLGKKINKNIFLRILRSLIFRGKSVLQPYAIYTRNQIKKCLPIKMVCRPKTLNFKQSQNQLLANEIYDALLNNEINLNDYVLIHTADGDLYRAMLSLILKPDVFEHSPKFHICTPYEETVMPGWKTGLSVDRVVDSFDLLGALEKKIFLYAENDLLARHLQSIFHVPVDVLNLPPPDTSISKPTGRNTGVISITYLGSAREEKGFLFLPEIIEQLWKEKSLINKVQFIIQCSPQIIGYSSNIKMAIEKLKQFPMNFVKLLEKPLSTDEYYKTLNDADAVLLCYEQSKYKVRSSGIAVEAVSLGKVVIATKDTFPAYLAGDAAIEVNTAEQIVQAIENLHDNFEFYREKALARGVEYRENNSAKAYIEKIICKSEKSIQYNVENDEHKEYGKSIANKSFFFDKSNIEDSLVKYRNNWIDENNEPAAKLKRLLP